MKKMFALIIIIIFTAFLKTSAFANFDLLNNDITGRWAEKISERVVMDIYSNEDNSEYSVFITWREDNLAQKDIYRFKAKTDANGNLSYKNGIHIYRYFDNKKNFIDKTDYTDGFGIIKINKNELIWEDNKDNTKTEFKRANKDLIKDTTAKNKYFSILLPQELKGIYEIKTEKDKISVFHKNSKKAGFGGFAFGIKAFKNPSGHANLPGGRKIGELTDKKGALYDMVLKYPTDVQYDYVKNDKPPESFAMLYNLGEIINIQGIKGSTYFKNQGMKGQNLYKDILKKHITAIEEKWDSRRLENENMSYMYNVLAQNNKNLLDKIGYTYYDLNADGTEELLIGEITNGSFKGVIYDIYTMVNRVPKHVISGGSRNRYFACNTDFICNEYSSGANESGIRIYILTENSTELFPQLALKYDGYKNPKNPWFLTYGSDFEKDEWDNISKEKYDKRKSDFEKYKRFDFIPLSKVK